MWPFTKHLSFLGLLLWLVGVSAMGMERFEMDEGRRAPGVGKVVLPADLATHRAPPIAKRQPVTQERHGMRWEDPYAWLRDKGYPEVKDAEVLGYLEAENDYFEAVLKPHEGLTKELFEELKGRIKDADASVPVKDGGWLYQWRFEVGAQYRTWWRRAVAGGEEELILDEPRLAAGHDYFKVAGVFVSPDGRWLAWTSDLDGSERWVIRVKDLESGEVTEGAIRNAGSEVVWGADSESFVYVELNEQLRPYRARLHRLEQAGKGEDPVLYEEGDSSFFVHVGRTQSRKWLLISTGDHVTSEVRVIPAGDPLQEPVTIAPRRAGHEYHLEHARGRFYIRTNDRHRNFRVVTAREEAPGEERWEELIGGSDRHYLRGLTCFADVLVVEERVDGLDQIRLRKYGGEESYIAFPEANYAVKLGSHEEFEIQQLRLSYESMVTPRTVYDYDLAGKKLIVRKVQEIPSGYDASGYETVRLMAPARDGAMIPVSVVYRKDFKKDRSQPVHLYGYGAYGIGMPPGFFLSRLSLLDRGFAYAIAHIRGGDDLGYGWYEAGKLMRRMNTFTDFIDAANFLVEEEYASAGNISISGGSAGGGLVGAVVNMAPELWRAAVAHVPFVDVLNTMLDDTLPLTPIEWPEWGNPIEDREVFCYIRSYSPYDNVRAQAYPPILITAGLHDPRVTYWEPAKWAARLRAVKTDENLLLLKTNMGAGHGGQSGRYESLRETAEEFTFLLMAFGKALGGAERREDGG